MSVMKKRRFDDVVVVVVEDDDVPTVRPTVLRPEQVVRGSRYANNSKEDDDERTIDTSIDTSSEKTEPKKEDKTNFLRAFMGDYYFNGAFTYHGKIDWSDWSNDLPQSNRQIAAFVVKVAEQHQSQQYGSFELQILLTAVNSIFDDHDDIVGGICRLIAQSSVLSGDMKDRIKTALLHRTTFVCLKSNGALATRFYNFRDVM